MLIRFFNYPFLLLVLFLLGVTLSLHAQLDVSNPNPPTSVHVKQNATKEKDKGLDEALRLIKKAKETGSDTLYLYNLWL